MNPNRITFIHLTQFLVLNSGKAERTDPFILPNMCFDLAIPLVQWDLQSPQILFYSHHWGWANSSPWQAMARVPRWGTDDTLGLGSGCYSDLNDTVTATQAQSGEVNRDTQKNPGWKHMPWNLSGF